MTSDKGQWDIKDMVRTGTLRAFSQNFERVRWSEVIGDHFDDLLHVANNYELYRDYPEYLTQLVPTLRLITSRLNDDIQEALRSLNAGPETKTEVSNDI